MVNSFLGVLAVSTVLGSGALLIDVLLNFLRERSRRRGLNPDEEPFDGTDEAITDLSPDGHVFFEGAVWSADSSVAIPRGGVVRVTRRKGIRLHVEPPATENHESAK